MWPNPQETADLVTFTKEILNRKHFLWSVNFPCDRSCSMIIHFVAMIPFISHKFPLEVATGECSAKMVLIKTLQNSQGKSCAGLAPVLQACDVIKKRLLHRYFTVNFNEISNNTSFVEDLRANAFVPPISILSNTMHQLL